MKICLCFLIAVLVVDAQTNRQRVMFSNDFESGTTSPWFDQSAARINWKIESFDSPTEVDNPAPRPPSGTKYLRATRYADLTSGLAVLKSQTFAALPDVKITFSFWIHSRQPQASNLELYWVEGNKEHLLISLSQYSSSSNFEWRSVSVRLPLNSSTDISLIFYGFCGRNPEDAVAVDDIAVLSESVPPTSTTPNPTTVTVRPSCGAELNSPSGFFSSPKYPNNYDSNLECSWLITTSTYSRIAVTFSAFYTQPDNDVLKIYDGSSTLSSLLLTHSGTLRPLRIESTSNVLLVTFSSDSAVNYVGFMGHYESFT